MKKIIILASFLLILPFELLATAPTYDLGISSSDISFSQRLVAYQKIRVYAAIHNTGKEDVQGYVTFYQGDILIGDSQVVSVRAGGLADEVYVDWTVPLGSFNIRAEINGQKPQDENPDNDLAISTLFVPLPDNDKDGIPDEEDDDDDNDGVRDNNESILGTDPKDPDTDNDGCWDGNDDFPLDPSECYDSDGDGIGDNKDTDNDNDGLSDAQENKIGTDPKNPDTDGDGVIDSQDDFPLDPDSSVKRTVINTPKLNSDNSNQSPDLNNNNENLNLSADDFSSAELSGEINLDLYANEALKPKISINVIENGWNDFVFTADLKGLIDDNLSYHWDFGDGITSNQQLAEHSYKKAGKYKVALTLSGKNDLELTTNKEIKISFFNMANYKLWLLIGVLGLVLAVLVAVIASLRNKAYKL